MSDESGSWAAQEPTAPSTPSAADNTPTEPAAPAQPQAFVTDESIRLIVPGAFVTDLVAKDMSETPQPNPQPQPLPTETSERGQKGK
jgi:hypothetical protein